MSLDNADKQWLQEQLQAFADRLIESMMNMQTEILRKLREIETKPDDTSFYDPEH